LRCRDLLEAFEDGGVHFGGVDEIEVFADDFDVETHLHFLGRDSNHDGVRLNVFDDDGFREQAERFLDLREGDFRFQPLGKAAIDG